METTKAVALRQQLFGEPSPPLSVLTTNPDSVLALARKTFSKGPRRHASTTTTRTFRVDSRVELIGVSLEQGV